MKEINGFAENDSYQVFAKSLGRTIERSKLYQYHQRQRTGERPEKDRIRKDTVDYVFREIRYRSGDAIDVLTLSGPLWIFEKELFRRVRNIKNRKKKPRPRLYFTSCEKDWTTFEYAALTMPHKRGSTLEYPTMALMSYKLNCQIVKSDGFRIVNKDIFDYLSLTDRKFNCVWIDTTSPITHFGYRLKNILQSFKPNGIFILTALKARETESVVDRTQYILDRMPGFELINKSEYMDSSPMLHLILKNKCNTEADLLSKKGFNEPVNR